MISQPGGLIVIFLAISVLGGLVFSKGKNVIACVGIGIVVFICLLLLIVLWYTCGDLWLLHRFLRGLVEQGHITWWG